MQQKSKIFLKLGLTTIITSLLCSPAWAITLTLYGAGSLRNSLSEVANTFTQETGIDVTTVFGPSGLLRERLELGEKADIFTAADIGNPLQLYQKGLSEPVINFTTNRMVAILRPGLSVTSDTLLSLLLDPQIKVGTSTPISDPSGDYAQEIFRKAEQIQAGSFQILDNKALRLVGGINSPPVPPDTNNLVYFLKDTQQADVFLAYYTSGLSAREIAPDLQIVELPDNLSVQADYGLTVLNGATPEAQDLVQYILSPQGQQILATYGFTSPENAPSVPVPEPDSIFGLTLALAGGLVATQKRKVKKKKE